MSTAVAAFPNRVLNHLKWRQGHFVQRVDEWKTSARRAYYRRILMPRYRLPEISLSSLGASNIEVAPLIMDDICMPPHHSFLDSDDPLFPVVNGHDDITPLLAIATSRKPLVVLELGTAHGNTTANICNSLPNAKVYTVNAPVEDQTGEVITFELTRDEVGRVYRNHGFSGQVVQIYKNTLHLDLSQYFTEPVIDLAIVDACHDEEYVINDFLKVKPYIKPGGIVMLHDTDSSMEHHLMGSYGACLKLRRMGYDIRHIDNTWWGVWMQSN